MRADLALILFVLTLAGGIALLVLRKKRGGIGNKRFRRNFLRRRNGGRKFIRYVRVEVIFRIRFHQAVHAGNGEIRGSGTVAEFFSQVFEKESACRAEAHCQRKDSYGIFFCFLSHLVILIRSPIARPARRNVFA